MSWRAVLSFVVVLATATLHAQDHPSSFDAERPVQVPGAGPARLDVDVTLLAGASPFTTLQSFTDADGETRYIAHGGLSDLRFFSAAGQEVPYILVHPPRAEPMWTNGLQVLATPETKKTSGFEADLGDARRVDAIRVHGLPAPLLKRLRLEGSGDRAHWTVLLDEATLFDLPAERLRQVQLTFPPGAYRYLRVTWNDTNSGRVPLPLTVAAREVAVAATPALAASVIVETRPSEPGRSRYRLRLPAARLPIIAIRLNVGNDHVLRTAAVTEARLAGSQAVPVELGRATLRRVVRDAAAAEALRIPISTPDQAQLDLVVEDGNNPPLDLRGVEVEFAQLPFVYFESTGQPLVARYGNRGLDAPRYDLEAARDNVAVAAVPTATWGEARRASTEPAPAQAPAQATGATIDSTAFKVQRRIPPGPAGLVSLELDAPVLAHSAGGRSLAFSDVRIVDGAGRQVPYLLERRDEPHVLDLPMSRTTLAAREFKDSEQAHFSAYAITLPYEKLPASRLVLTASAAVFSRRVRVGVQREADRRHRDAWFEVISAADWRHDERSGIPPTLVIELPHSPAKNLVLVVDEGDNAPLRITQARLLLPAYRARFYRARDADLRLAYGHASLGHPQYDLQMLASEVLGDPAVDVRALPEQREAQEVTASAQLISQRVFWGALIVSIVVLLGLVAKLVSRPPVA